MLPVKANFLVPGREFIVSRRKKLVPKIELGERYMHYFGQFGCRNHMAWQILPFVDKT